MSNPVSALSADLSIISDLIHHLHTAKPNFINAMTLTNVLILLCESVYKIKTHLLRLMIRRITGGLRNLGHILNNASDRPKYSSRGATLLLRTLSS